MKIVRCPSLPFRGVLVALLLHAGFVSSPEAQEDLNPIMPEAINTSVGLAGERPADISRYLLARGAESALISPDGRKAAIVRSITRTRQLWVIDLDNEQSAPTQLTFGSGVRTFYWLPDSSSLIYTADKDGNEKVAFYLISADGTRERLVMPAPEKGFRLSFALSADGSRFAYASTERNGVDFDIHVADTATGESELVYEGTLGYFVAAWVPGYEKLLVSETVGEDANNLYLLDLDSGELITIYAPEVPANHTSSFYGASFAFSPNGDTTYFSTNNSREFLAMGSRPTTAQGDFTVIDETDHDLANPVICGGRYLAYTMNTDGIDQLRVRNLETGQAVTAPDLPEGTLRLSCADEMPRMILQISAFATPGDLYLWDVGQGSPRRIFNSTLAGLGPEDFVRPVSVTMPARDGLELQGLLYLPSGSSEQKPPLLFIVHGGPTSESRASFSAISQYYTARGIAVFATNIRGSTGRGRTYTALDNREKRLDSVRDVVDMLDYFRGDERVDASRAAVKGGSYGGYVVNSVLGTYPDAFDAGVALFGIGDWVTGLQVVPPFLRASDIIEYGDIEDPKWLEFYTENSPIRNADKIRVPVLYSHGANDPRIDKAETEIMVRALRENGIEAPYILLPDEGHGWRKLGNKQFYYRREAEFLERVFARE